MSVLYMIALFVGSAFWVAAIVWIIMGYMPKLKALFKKSVDGYQLTKEKARDNHKVIAQKIERTEDHRHDQVHES